MLKSSCNYVYIDSINVDKKCKCREICLVKIVQMKDKGLFQSLELKEFTGVLVPATFTPNQNHF